MQRYDLDFLPSHGGGSPFMEEAPDGNYVRYEDAAALEAENAKLREELAQAKKALQRILAYGTPCDQIASAALDAMKVAG